MDPSAFESTVDQLSGRVPSVDQSIMEIAPRQGPLTPVLTPINVKAESGEAVPQSTQHGSDETLDSNSAESSIVGSEEDELKAEQHSPEEEAEYFKFTDVFQRQSSILFGPVKNTGIESFIKLSYQNKEHIGPHVLAGRYDLFHLSGEIILRADWQSVIQPGCNIKMVLSSSAIEELGGKIQNRKTEARSEEKKGRDYDLRVTMDIFRAKEDDNEPCEDSPPAILQATIARRPTAPTMALDLKERTAEDNSKPDQDQSKLQLPAASEPVGEEGSFDRLVELERSQKNPSEPPNLLEESFIRTDDLDRKDGGIDMSHDDRRLQRG